MSKDPICVCVCVSVWGGGQKIPANENYLTGTVLSNKSQKFPIAQKTMAPEWHKVNGCGQAEEVLAGSDERGAKVQPVLHIANPRRPLI